jgi:hypothetical protein
MVAEKKIDRMKTSEAKQKKHKSIPALTSNKPIFVMMYFKNNWMEGKMAHVQQYLLQYY